MLKQRFNQQNNYKIQVMMDHVYGKRNKLAIFLRSLETRFYDKVSVFGKKHTVKISKTVLCYPRFKSLEQFANTINKFAWAFPEQSEIKIRFSLDPSIDIDIINISSFLENQGLYFKNNINIEKIAIKEEEKYLSNSSLIAVHDKNCRYSWSLLPYLSKVKIIDPKYYSLKEGNFWKFGYYDLLTKEEKQSFQSLSIQNFVEFKCKNRHKVKTNIFVTGPSFSSYTDYNFGTDSINIVCNTIVKDTEFLEYIGGPNIITFADPVFHFSSCDYAHEFRRLVMETVKKYDSYIAVPASTIPLLIGNYPELKHRIIGLRRAEQMVFPNENFLGAKPSGSIITFLMLPLASSLTNEVYVLGADGRGNSENYFWKHNEKVQLEELKSSVFLTHPSFFRDRDYVDHYEKHCKYVEEIINIGEGLGKKYFSLTKSHVPAFSKRLYNSDSK